MTCPFFSYFNKFEHPDISSNLEENCLISFRDSNKKQTYGTRNNKKSLIVCPFLLYYFNNFEHQNICMILARVVSFTLSEKNKEQQNGARDSFVLIVQPYTIFSSGTQTGYKGYSSSLLYSFSPTLEQSETALKEKKAVKKENVIPLEINLANLKLGIEGIIKTIRG